MEVYHAKDSVVASELDGSAVLLDLDAGRYFSLNTVSAFLWQKLASPSTVVALSEAVSLEFEVSPDRCRQDIVVLLAELSERGLVVRSQMSVE